MRGGGGVGVCVGGGGGGGVRDGFMAKRKLILTLKEVLLTIFFLFVVYDVALLVDKVLVYVDRDLDAMPSNIITYITVFCFIVFQKYIFRNEVK